MGQFAQGDRQTVERVAPSGGVVADQGYIIESEFVIAMETVAAGAVALFLRRGGHNGSPKKAADAFAAGAPVYFNATTGEYEAAGTLTNYYVGTAHTAAIVSDESVDLDFNGGQVFPGLSVPGDITNVIAGTALSGGGSTGAVTLNVAFGTSASTACVGNDARLSDTRTPSSTLSHAASHAEAGSDAITPAAIGACADNDARLTDARTPSSTLAHAASHATGQADALTPADIGAAADDHGHDADEIDYTVPEGGFPGEATPTTVQDAIDSIVVVLENTDASLIAYDNDESGLTAETVQAAIDELETDKMSRGDIESKLVTVAALATSGVTAADPDWVDATVIGCVPNSGNDQIIQSVAVAGDGVVTVTLDAGSTAEAKFNVTALLA